MKNKEIVNVLGDYEKYLDDYGMLADGMADNLIAEIRYLREINGSLSLELEAEKHNHKRDNEYLQKQLTFYKEMIPNLDERDYLI